MFIVCIGCVTSGVAWTGIIAYGRDLSIGTEVMSSKRYSRGNGGVALVGDNEASHGVLNGTKDVEVFGIFITIGIHIEIVSDCRRSNCVDNVWKWKIGSTNLTWWKTYSRDARG